MKETISYRDFQKLDLRVGRIVVAEPVEKSEKLLRVEVDIGSPSTGSGDMSETRQVLAGIGKRYAPEELVGRSVVVIVNLEPRTMMGLESQGMLLAASGEEGPVLLAVSEEVSPGSLVS